MRANLDVDDELLAEAMKAGACEGATTKKAVVEAGLRVLIQTHRQTNIRRLRGKVEWVGNLEESRLNRFVDWE
jgi:Arc/MetJ family transcription regulator